MSESGLPAMGCAKRALFALFLMPPLCMAENAMGSNGAAAQHQNQLSIRLVVRPVLRVLDVTPVKDGQQYRIWTNMKSATFQGREYRFDRIGEHTLTVPGNAQPVALVLAP